MAVLLCFTWLPVLVVFGVTLWLRAQSISRLEEQRRLDRCLYQAINQRCAALTHLSESNLALKRIAQALAALKVADGIVSIALPGIGKAAGAVMEIGASGARAMAKAIEASQDASLAAMGAQQLSLWRCGPVLKGAELLGISRGQSVIAAIAGVAAPLEWRGPASRSELEVMSWWLTARSFAHCARKPSKASMEAELLDGESYQVRFDRPFVARLPSRSLSSWPWPYQ